jgi:hypothetical protein
MEHRWNETDGGKPKYLGEKPVPVPLCPTTNPTWTDPGSNPGLRGDRRTTNLPEPWHGLQRLYRDRVFDNNDAEGSTFRRQREELTGWWRVGTSYFV